MADNTQSKSSNLQTSISARGIIRVGEWILLARFERGGFYFLPGGRLEYGEASPEALMRELREEIVDFPEPAAASFVGLHEHSWNKGSELVHELNLIWTLHFEQDVHRSFVSAEPHLSFHWIRFDNLSTINLLPDGIAQHIRNWTSRPTEAMYGYTLPLKIRIER